jgi:uncharacterized sporulation protein YeaH/YhbH (DUF444 family)
MKDKEEYIENTDNRILDYFLGTPSRIKPIYAYSDQEMFSMLSTTTVSTSRIFDLERLLEKDKLREKDGFPRKIKLGKLVKPVKNSADKTVVIPTTTEEKLYHWNMEPDLSEGSPTGGTGDGEEGEVIGEESLRPSDEGEGAGHGKGGEHGMGADAYEIGRILTEQFELPNIKTKGKKTSLTKFTYELSDRNPGHGQILDKKATLRKIVKTNLALGYLSRDNINSQNLIITPGDRVYRILSKEKDYESQAIVFFVRDYSGSMQGKPTEAVVTQHIYIYSWLLYQYQRQVKSRFILHDTEAEEVPDFYTYYNKNVAGGTQVVSAYKMVNQIVEEENLARDYNIYIFHGTDGDDWDTKGEETISELKKMLLYANRIGITIAENTYSRRGNTIVENYLKKSKLLETDSDLLHFDSFKADDAKEERIIAGIKELIS